MHYVKPLRLLAGLLATGTLLTLNACQDHRLAPDPQTLPDATVYAINDANQLIRLSIRNTMTPQATMGITGLQAGERVLSIDFRPATGQLYGVTNQSRVVVLNITTGAASIIGTAPFSPAISGAIVGIDFNPTVDRLRLVTNTGQDLRLNPETGALATAVADGNINGIAGAMISEVAYTNNQAGAATTTLYDIDPATDRLYIQNPPNNGTLTDVGPLGLDITGAAGFDIAPNGTGLVAVIFGGKPELQQINLTTGRLQKLGDLSSTIIGLAIPTDPVAYAVDATPNLLVFNPMSPTPVSKAITGLQAGEMIFGLDFRPVNGQLYALGSTSRLYTINTATGAAAVVGSPLATPLSGTDFGFDFNPTVDRIRVVSNTGQNLRLNPNDGTIAATDGTLNPGTPSVTGAAYTNNFAGATTTTLYGIDNQGAMAMLVQQSPPNNGTLVPVGSLGVTAEAANGFDIGGTSGMAYALLRVGGTTRVYSINLTSGAATAGAMLPGNPMVRGFALGLGF